MRAKRFRLLTVLLTAVMLVALSLNVFAASSNAVTQDGLTVQLFTDKDSYEAGESVSTTVRVDNHTGKKVFIFTSVNLPDGVTLANEKQAYDAVLKNGETWTTPDGVLPAGSAPTGTSVATGDNAQVGYWIVLLILAVCGITALIVYGKKKKIWLPMLLCLAMVGSLVSTAIPVQAADISGSMEVSCTIQVEGKDAEVSAIVNYIIYDDADENADKPADPTEEPGETVTPAPGETETPAPGETETPAPGETETPSDVPSEAGYYVVWDDFTFCAINEWTDGMFSSWDVVLPQGAPTHASDGASFSDGSEYAKAQALRAFNAIADDFTMEFTMRMSAGMEDTVIDLKNGDTTAIRFAVEGDKLLLGEEELCVLPTDALKNFKLHISPANGTYTISVDGETVMDGDAAKEFAFANSTDAIDRLYIETGVEEMGQVVIGTVRVYVDYYVNEKFLDGTNLAINDEWTLIGDAATIYKKGTQGPDKYNALLQDGEGITRDVAYEQDGAWVEFQQLMEENVGEFAMILADEAGNEFKVATKDGKFGYYNGDEFVGLYDCVANLWYHVMLKQTDAGTELYLNHKLKADKLPNVKFTKMTFTATGGEAMLDDIVVKDWIPLPEDYVPEPVAVEKEAGAKLVGLQSCNLWVEGEHFGYDWLTDWEERTPILGYYDEISTESADWELKFKIEHGIDFELYCWYRTTDGQGEPIKMPRNSRALHEGYMNAEYSDQMKFAITWESGSGGKDLQDFKDNIVPYWIEQYFKDDRYLLVDNKPLIGMYNITKLKSYFGGTIAGVKEAMDYLRQACVDAGFDGAYIIMCNSSASSAQEIAQASFDGQYAYTWGPSSNMVSTQTQGMESIQNTLEAASLGSSGVVPTVSQGYWDKAWDRNDGNYASVETFQKVLQWVKEDFMPTLDQNSIGSKMVLLDNWNEYGEGHFIMPANLAGFGYVDAIKTVFGDGEACEEAVQHLEPTQAQLDRIQHMYIQDRHVVLVDKDGAASDVVPMEGYNWTFEAPGDTEGWAVGFNDGKWIKELKDWAVKDGDFYGLTFTPEELSVKVESGELPTGATADPSLMSPDNLGLNASQAIAIKIRMKGVGGLSAVGKPAIYFITEDDQKWSSGKMVDAFYEEGTDGYTEITFNMTTNTLWTGTIKQIRFDPIERDGEFWVDSIQIMKRAESGDAEIYMDGERVYTAAPIETVDGAYMFPVGELENLTNVYVNESLDKSRLFVYTDTAFYEFPYEGDTKMLVNGVAVGSVGAVTINDMLYVPIVDIFENIGTVTDATGATHPTYTVTITPATADAKTKIEINKYVDSSVLKGYYFTSSAEGWTWGGGNTEKTPVINGIGALEIVGNGQNTKLWSPEAAEEQFNVNAAKADHIRMIVKTNAASENPTFKMDVYGDGTSWSYTYNITLTDDMLNDAGYYVVLLDLEEAKAAGLMPASEIDRVCIWYYDNTAGGIQTFAMDSFELLDLVEDGIEDEEPEEAAKVLIEESPYTIYDWDFTESISGWVGGGATGIAYDADNEALTITVNNQRANAWSSDGTNPVNVSAADATHVLVRVQTDAEITRMGLDVQFAENGGLLNEFAYYANIPYATDVNGDLYALVDLTSGADYAPAKTIGRINIYPIGNTITEADNGKVVNITSVEILDKNWYAEFDSTYFTNSVDGYMQGGTTGLKQADAALVITPPTKADDFNPRIWSMGETGGVFEAPYGYTADDVTHVRVRLKAVIPEELPTTMTEEEKTALEAITSVGLRLNLQFTDGSFAYPNPLSYNIGTEDYVTLTYDVSSYLEGKELARIGFNLFDSNQELLCKAGTTVMIDSVQFLRRTSEEDESQALKVLIIGNSITQHDPRHDYGWAGDWGMAATSADKDYVHLLEDSILAKNGAVEVKAINIAEYEKYFYDFSKISDTKDKYANWNADIIIATFGANVQNGANENDSSYENDYIFSTDKYKKIIDKFNPDGDATVIAGATVLTSEQIVKVIRDAATEYGYTYVDMTEWTADEYRAYDYEDEILAYYQQVTGDTSKTDVNDGVLGHPGDIGMEKIAEELWAALEPMIPQGIPAVDDEPDTPVTPDVPDTPSEPEVKPAFAWDFEEGDEGWVGNAAAQIGRKCENDAAPYFLTLAQAAENSTQAQFWTTNVMDGNTYPSIDMTNLDKIELRVKSLTTEKQTLLVGAYSFGDTAVELGTYTTAEIANDWTVLTINASDIKWGEAAGDMNRFFLRPSNPGAVSGEIFAIDYFNIYTKAAEETPSEPTYNVVKAWTLDTNTEGWEPGGAPTSHGYDAAKTAYKLETAVDTTSSLKGPDVTLEALTLDDFDTIRIQLTGGTPNAVFTFQTSFNDATHSNGICAVNSQEVTLDAVGNATVMVDCSNATLGTAGVLQAIRINVTSAGVNTCYIDSVELLKLVTE